MSSSLADDTRIWRSISSPEDCSLLQSDLQSVYCWADNVNKFEWVRYEGSVPAPPFKYQSPNQLDIELKDNLRDLGVRMSSDLTFHLHIEKVVTTASQMVGWGM